MEAARIFRKSAGESIAHLRSLIPSTAGMIRSRALPPSLVNWEICEPILDKLDLTAYQRTTIIDMNPNLGIFSAALHERLQPKQHILLEPEKRYGDRMREFQELYENSWYVPLDGYNWDTYKELFSKDQLPPPWPNKFTKPKIKTSLSTEGINPDLLFVGHMSKSPKSQRLMAQFISCCTVGSWIQRYGRVRFLLWVPDVVRDRYLPRSIAARTRPSAWAEAIVDITEVATSNEIRTGKGIQKLQVINQDNVHLEEMKPGPSKQQEIKSEIRKQAKLQARLKLIEHEIKKLVAEELDFVKTRGRPKKILSRGEEKILEKTTAKFRKIVEAIHDGEEPELPGDLPDWQRVMMLNKCDEIRRTFGYKTKEEAAVEKVEEGENQWRRKSPHRGKPATVGELKKIEERIKQNLGLWIQGMEHPPWYYRRNKKELRKLAIRIAAMHPASRVDPKEAVQPEDFYSIMEEEIAEDSNLPEVAATGEGPSSASTSVGMGGDKSAAQAWEEYEERWSRGNYVKARDQSREDQIYAVHHKLLKIYDRPYEPLLFNPKGDFFPHTPMTLLELVPKVPHPFFCPPTPGEREKNWLTFQWLLSRLFVLRASSVSSALRSIAPGAENILEELPPDQAIQPTRRVRCLDANELVNLTMAWMRWPFRGPDAHLEEYSDRHSRYTEVRVR